MRRRGKRQYLALMAFRRPRADLRSAAWAPILPHWTLNLGVAWISTQEGVPSCEGPDLDAPRDPYGRAMLAIRRRMRSGRLVLGEQLRVSDLSREFHLGVTPIREALARLAGEGLIEDRRGAGYFARRLDAVDLVELYDLQVAYLLAAQDRAGQPRAGSLPSLATSSPLPREVLVGDDGLEAIEAALLTLIQRGHSLALQRAHDLLADRLAPARRVEAEVSPSFQQEWSELTEVVRTPGGQALRAWVAAYHERRRQAAPAIIAAMRSAASGQLL